MAAKTETKRSLYYFVDNNVTVVRDISSARGRYRAARRGDRHFLVRAGLYPKPLQRFFDYFLAHALRARWKKFRRSSNQLSNKKWAKIGVNKYINYFGTRYRLCLLHTTKINAFSLG